MAKIYPFGVLTVVRLSWSTKRKMESVKERKAKGKEKAKDGERSVSLPF